MSEHDPICGWTPGLLLHNDHLCQCDLIARVREDERRTLTGGERHREWWIAFGMGKLRGRADALAAARDAADVALLGTLQSTRDRVLAAIDALAGES